MRIPVVFAMACMTAVTLSASTGPQIDVATHARGSTRVVVATVTDVDSEFDVNDFGDRLIVSRVSLRIEEALKGPRETAVVMTIEGGTVGELTLSVSDMPVMARGERAVLFLNMSASADHIPHGRGSGVLKLDADNRVSGTNLTLDDIRAAVRTAQNQGNR